MTAILITLLGAALIVTGAWLFKPAAGVIVLGLLVLAFGLLAEFES